METTTVLNREVIPVCAAQVDCIEAIKDNYSYHIQAFTDWLRFNGRCFDADSFVEYIRDLNESDYAATTKILKRQAVKKRVKQLYQDADYQTYAKVQQFLDRLDEDFETRAPRVNTAAVGSEKVLDKSEVRRMLKAATDRQACFIRFLGETGCRVSELTGIKPGHITDKGEKVVTLKVTGKGRKERSVKVTRTLYELVQDTFRGGAVPVRDLGVQAV